MSQGTLSSPCLQAVEVLPWLASDVVPIPALKERVLFAWTAPAAVNTVRLVAFADVAHPLQSCSACFARCVRGPLTRVTRTLSLSVFNRVQVQYPWLRRCKTCSPGSRTRSSTYFNTAQFAHLAIIS